MNAEYTSAAYEKAIFEYLRKHLEEKFMPGGGGIQEKIICEDVPYSQREVTTEAIAGVVLRLSSEAKQLEEELRRFTLKREDVRPVARAEKPERKEPGDQPAGPPAPRGKRAPKPSPETGGSQ